MTFAGVNIKDKDIVIIGWPTSGKTYLTDFLSTKTDHLIIHTDDYYERIGDFKKELYVLLDDLKAIDRPVIVEGILGYRLLRKGVELNCFHPEIVIEIEHTYEAMQKIYITERKPKNYEKGKALSIACETVLKDYKAMVNPSRPTWIKIKHKDFGYILT